MGGMGDGSFVSYKLHLILLTSVNGRAPNASPCHIASKVLDLDGQVLTQHLMTHIESFIYPTNDSYLQSQYP